MKITETWKYSKASTEAMYRRRYAGRITEGYLSSFENWEKDLDPKVLEQHIESQQRMALYTADVLALLGVIIPLKWIIKRKIRKRRKAR